MTHLKCSGGRQTHWSSVVVVGHTAPHHHHSVRLKTQTSTPAPATTKKKRKTVKETAWDHFYQSSRTADFRCEDDHEVVVEVKRSTIVWWTTLEVEEERCYWEGRTWVPLRVVRSIRRLCCEMKIKVVVTLCVLSVVVAARADGRNRGKYIKISYLLYYNQEIKAIIQLNLLIKL